MHDLTNALILLALFCAGEKQCPYYLVVHFHWEFCDFSSAFRWLVRGAYRRIVYNIHVLRGLLQVHRSDFILCDLDFFINVGLQKVSVPLFQCFTIVSNLLHWDCSSFIGISDYASMKISVGLTKNWPLNDLHLAEVKKFVDARSSLKTYRHCKNFQVHDSLLSTLSNTLSENFKL